MPGGQADIGVLFDTLIATPRDLTDLEATNLLITGELPSFDETDLRSDDNESGSEQVLSEGEALALLAGVPFDLTSAAEASFKFNPAQPRDWRGRWIKVPGLKILKLTNTEYRARRTKVRKVMNAAMKTHATEILHRRDNAWTPERSEQQRQVAESMYKRMAKTAKSDRRAVITGGLTGAGKTSTLKKSGLNSADYITLNPDDVKEEMVRQNMVPDDVPGAEDLSPMEHAPLIHWESHRIINLIRDMALRDGKNIIWDITMSSPAPVFKLLSRLRDDNYTTSTIFVDVPIDTSIQRSRNRHREGVDAWRNGEGLGGRYVPTEVIRMQEISPGRTINIENFKSVRDDFDSWELYDNSGDTPRLVESSSGNDKDTDATTAAGQASFGGSDAGGDSGDNDQLPMAQGIQANASRDLGRIGSKSTSRLMGGDGGARFSSHSGAVRDVERSVSAGTNSLVADAWKKQLRAPKGTPIGGQWVESLGGLIKWITKSSGKKVKPTATIYRKRGPENVGEIVAVRRDGHAVMRYDGKNFSVQIRDSGTKWKTDSTHTKKTAYDRLRGGSGEDWDEPEIKPYSSDDTESIGFVESRQVEDAPELGADTPLVDEPSTPEPSPSPNISDPDAWGPFTRAPVHDIQEDYGYLMPGENNADFEADPDFMHATYRVGDLTPTQDDDEMVWGDGEGDADPFVIVKNGVPYLVDGHHRAAQRGTDGTLDVWELNLDTKSDADTDTDVTPSATSPGPLTDHFDQILDTATKNGTLNSEDVGSATFAETASEDVNFPVEVNDAFNAYFNFSDDVNNELRAVGGDLTKLSSKKLKNQTTRMQDGFAVSRTKRDLIVFRGAKNGNAMFGDAWSNDMSGLSFTDHAYTSTSVLENVASEFADGGDIGQKVMMRIALPQDSPAVGFGGDEAEILLPPNSSFQVVRDNGFTDDGVRLLDVIPVGKPDVPSAPSVAFPKKEKKEDTLSQGIQYSETPVDVGATLANVDANAYTAGSVIAVEHKPASGKYSPEAFYRIVANGDGNFNLERLGADKVSWFQQGATLNRDALEKMLSGKRDWRAPTNNGENEGLVESQRTSDALVMERSEPTSVITGPTPQVSTPNSTPISEATIGPKSITPTKTVFRKGIQDGEVIAVTGEGNERLRWDANRKKFIAEERTDGSWNETAALSKSATFQRVKDGEWFEPGSVPDTTQKSTSEPVSPPVTVGPTTTPLTGDAALASLTFNSDPWSTPRNVYGTLEGWSVNALLRGAVDDENYPQDADALEFSQSIADGLDSMFDAAPPLTQPITVIRGVSHPDEIFGPDNAVGLTIRDRAFTSTTTDELAASTYMVAGDSPGARLEITVPSGAKAVKIFQADPDEDLDDVREEYGFTNEVLLPRDSTFRIDSDITQPDGARMIKMTVVESSTTETTPKSQPVPDTTETTTKASAPAAPARTIEAPTTTTNITE